MKITGKNPETGDEFHSETDDINDEFVESMSDFDLSDDAVKKIIDNLNISADAKSLLYSFSKAVIKVGKSILKIGRKIIDFVCKVFNDFPSATFGMIFGAIVGFLITSIPVLGVVLGPFFTPISIALGLLTGLKEDLKDKALARKIAGINAGFSPLRT